LISIGWFCYPLADFKPSVVIFRDLLMLIAKLYSLQNKLIYWSKKAIFIFFYICGNPTVPKQYDDYIILNIISHKMLRSRLILFGFHCEEEWAGFYLLRGKVGTSLASVF
jgi:hypothetical protein